VKIACLFLWKNTYFWTLCSQSPCHSSSLFGGGKKEDGDSENGCGALVVWEFGWRKTRSPPSLSLYVWQPTTPTAPPSFPLRASTTSIPSSWAYFPRLQPHAFFLPPCSAEYQGAESDLPSLHCQASAQHLSPPASSNNEDTQPIIRSRIRSVQVNNTRFATDTRECNFSAGLFLANQHTC